MRRTTRRGIDTAPTDSPRNSNRLGTQSYSHKYRSSSRSACRRRFNRHTARVTLTRAIRSEWLYDLTALVATRAALFAVGLIALAVLPIGPRHLDLMPHLPALN